MFDPHQRLALLDRLGIPVAGRRIVLDAVKYAPVRKVASRGGGNVITGYQSRKMQRQIDTESRSLEFQAAVGHEYDPDVREYYPQPCRLKMEIIDDQGEIHVIDHTPDMLVVTDDGLVLEEWKSWAKMAGLARRNPWRYMLDHDDVWRSSCIEQWLAERGIGYRIRTDRDIPYRRRENFIHLEDYFDPSAPPCPVDVEVRVRGALTEDPVLYLAELYDKAECQPDDVFKLIADGLLVADLDVASITEPNRCRVFRDTAVREFEYARHQPEPFPLPGVVDICAGAKLRYNHQSYTVSVVGSTKVVLTGDDGGLTEISLDNMEQLAASGAIVMETMATDEKQLTNLSDFTEDELKVALTRQRALDDNTLPERTRNRLEQIVVQARINGQDELVALVPRTRDRGNRLPRLSALQEELIGRVIREDHLTNRAPNKKHSYRKLETLCNEAGIKSPSYPTLITRIKALPQQTADRSRHGKRVAYQNAEFVPLLNADTPVHGSRPFQYVHADHTLLDIELVCSRTGKSLGRPWLSLAIDAFTRRILGICLSFDPPSYRSNMMLMRDIVRRHRRVPQFIVVDNGADFRSKDFELLASLMGIHVRFRPAGQPRYGSVMERIFGSIHTQYIHNLAGNTKALKNVRQTTRSFLPSRLAEWTLEWLYYGIEHWAFEYYDQTVHPTLGLSPREAFERGMAIAGQRPHRIVTLSKDFLIMTCPLVKRPKGLRTVDRQRGVKVHDRYFYWCPELSDPRLHGTKVPVKYDPWDASTVYVQIGKRWVPARCKALAGLGQMTEAEREVMSAEYVASRPHTAKDELSPLRLAEFMRTFTPKGVKELDLLRQQENRHLYQGLGIGAVSPESAVPLLEYAAPDLVPTPSQRLPRTIDAEPQAASARVNEDPVDVAGDDTPDYDSF